MQDIFNQFGSRGLNPNFTFSAFARNPNNAIAFAACKAVSEQAVRTNPFVIYGDSGLGKTHLLHSIGNASLSAHPTRKVIYLSCTDFIDAFAQSTKKNQHKEWREWFLQCDLLLIDDVQFLEQSVRAQLEFLQIFELLANKPVQVAVSCDKYPKDLGLKKSVRKVLMRGLLSDIEAYDEGPTD